ncbi:hypothetical protein [Aquimarina sediminis]|uniref:hypothetical protein n=1 Tax=Aquimarina sediminis TaxID=2070536 RepID=UPI000CA03FBC|nr:hypothetical protein [Aquimarina sediminis]
MLYKGKKNKRIYHVLLFCSISLLQLHAQNTNSFYVDMGGSFSTFQDVKYSNVRYNGFGGEFGMGYQKENQKAIWGVNFNAMFTSEKADKHNVGTARTNNLTVGAKYLYNVKRNLFVGATWDILDLYKKDFDGLQNNSGYDIIGSTLWASGVYDYKKFRFGLDVGLASYFRESRGFAFSVPQNVMESGDFDYQNGKFDDHFAFKYYELRTMPRHFQVRTTIRYQLSNKFSIAYKWHLRKFSEVKKYPVTYGAHSISIRYNVFNRIK